MVERLGFIGSIPVENRDLKPPSKRLIKPMRQLIKAAQEHLTHGFVEDHERVRRVFVQDPVTSKFFKIEQSVIQSDLGLFVTEVAPFDWPYADKVDFHKRNLLHLPSDPHFTDLIYLFGVGGIPPKIMRKLTRAVKRATHSF